MTIKSKTEEFILKAKEVHGDKYDYSLAEYVHSKSKVNIICPKHGGFLQRPNDHLRGKGCSKCKSEKTSNNCRSNKENFIKKAKEVHGDKYDYSLAEYVHSKSKVNIICPIHGDFIQKPNCHLSGKGCPKCGGTEKINTEEFINKSKKIHGDVYDYSTVDYNKNNIKVKIICPTHGEFLQTPNNHLRGQGCPNCNTSKGEQLISNYLMEREIKFIPQKKFSTCKYVKQLPYDFCIPQLKMLIEYDGIQHFQPIETFGGKEAFEITLKKDFIKTQWAKKNGWRLIRFDYTQTKDEIIDYLNFSIERFEIIK